MIGGVVVLGVVTTSVASWMVQSVAEETQAEVAQLTALLEAGDRGTYRGPKDEKSEL